MNLEINRLRSNVHQTLGEMIVYDDCYNEIYDCNCLELPDRDNKVGVSRIPAGVYDVVKRNSPKYGDHFLVKNVKNRSWILIHSGNTYKQTRGCILPGKGLGYVDSDRMLDVTYSKDTMKELNDILPDSFKMRINDEN